MIAVNILTAAPPVRPSVLPAAVPACLPPQPPAPPAYAPVRSATRNLADDARGFSAISRSVGRMPFAVTTRTRPACRPPGTPP